MRERPHSWPWKCAFTALPLTAILHHGLFYRPRCMLNGFGPDYDLATLLKWLAREPSLPWALLLAGVAYVCGLGAERYARLLRASVAPFVVAFIPLSVWIWDIPFSGRWICRSFHDERLDLAFIGVVHTRHFYLFGLVVYSLLLARSLFGRRTPSTSVPHA